MTLILAAKIGLTFKITCTFFFSQILLAGELTTSYFNVDTIAFKVLQYTLKLLI